MRDQQESTEMMSCGLSAEGEGIDVCQFRRPVYRRQPRSDCERCRLMRGAVRRSQVTLEVWFGLGLQVEIMITRYHHQTSVHYVY